MNSRTGIAVLILAALMAAGVWTAFAQESTPGQGCWLVSGDGMTAYDFADTTSDSVTLSAGDGGPVGAVSYDGQWIGFEPGIAQAGNIGLTRLRWVQTTDKYTLQGNCDNLPQVTPPPANACILTFGGTVTSYSEPDTTSVVYTTLYSTQYVQVGGEQADGWYAWSNPGAQAGSTGTYNLHWIQAADNVQMSGACDQIPIYYPVPSHTGDICTVLLNNQGQTYDQPNTDAVSNPLPGMLVWALAKTADGWYGYDSAAYLDDARGVSRLQWISPDDVSQTHGACESLPAVNPVPTAVTAADDGTSVALNVGDTLTITLDGNPTTGYTWVLAPPDSSTTPPTNTDGMLQQQGDPEFAPSSSAIGAGGEMLLTFQAIGAGETTLSLSYARPWETGTPPQGTFTLDVTVSAAN